MEKNFQIKLVETEEELKKVFEVRERVFIEEQNVDRSEEFDEYEESSRHLIALNSDNEGIGCSRWRETSKGIKLERFAVDKQYRSKGVGDSLVKETLTDIEKIKGNGNYLYLHAQIGVVPLYERNGFQMKGGKFIECDIWHYFMFREL